jgi:SHS2 domain-containing protein
MTGRGHESLEHTADMGLRGWGGSPAEAFEETALAMFDLIIDRKGVFAEKDHHLSLGGRDLTELLIEFLNELLSLADVEDSAFVSVRIERLDGGGDEWDLEAVVGGIPRAKCRKRLLSEVKAATWYGASISREGSGRWVAGCVVDL